MKFQDAMAGVHRLFLDTSPVIYHVEGVLAYQPLTDLVFQNIGSGGCEAITSTITLAECLVLPYRKGDLMLVQKFRDVIVKGVNTIFVGVDAVAEQSAEFRARYNLTLPDAFQIATAHNSKCDAFLTNDSGLKKVSELTVLILDELEA